MGQHSNAYRELSRIIHISNTLRISEENNKMMELMDLKNSMQRAADLREAHYKLEMNKKLVVLLFCILFLAIASCIYAIWKYRIISQKNRKMVRLAGEMIDYKKRVTSNNREVGLEKSKMSAIMPNQSGNDGKQSESGDYSDLSLFIQFEQEVKEQQLFLNYQLGREYYTKLMGVDKNHFAQVLKKNGYGNLNNFLNNMRLEHAVSLLREGSSLSINDIAAQSALPSSSTFFRLFKEKYGMSPKKFKEILIKQ